jgi:TP901 family phage tail tape measure protein
MAAFNLTAELNIRGPSNLNRVVADIRRQLSTVSLDVTINPNTSRGIQAVTSDVRNLSAALRDAQTNAVALGTALRGIGGSFNNLASGVNNLGNSLGRVSTQSAAVSSSIRSASSEMAEFGKQSALAIRRFAAFSVATGAVYALARAVTSAYGEFVIFNKEFVRLQQVTESTKSGLSGLSSEITRLSTTLGVSSSELLTVSVTLAQAGLSAGETKKALEALAKSALAPSFDNLNNTVEGSIALMRQFGIGAGDLESALGSVNAVAAKFAVEAGDIISAIQRTGGVFAAASKGVTEGKDALNEFLAVFTSVRATTRESAETIATGLRTIFTRIQRTSTIDALKDFGITLTDLEGKFVGPFEAVRRLADGLKSLDPRDLRFSKIVEELGGFRQIGKVIPLIQQFTTAQQALAVAQKGSGSLAADAATAQEALAVRITKVREQFVALIRDIGQSSNFQAFADVSLKLASALISVADAAKDVLPALAAITAIRGVGALGQFFSGFSGGVSRRPRGFATGGYVPGSGNGDTVPAMLTPGEFVIRKKAVEAIGASNLNKLNKGGRVKRFSRGGMARAPMIDDILQTSGSVLPKPSAIDALIKAGGGAVDIDRTIKRTIGDKAYSKAPSLESQKNVLSKYFVDDKNRLQDIQSAPLTAFGKSLQQAIKTGQLKASNVSIISKSRRTSGVPEYLSQLFGIPMQNMIFTQGGDKQPAVDAMRSKGPRASRVSRFNLGGLVQKFAQKSGGSYRSGSVKPLNPAEQSELEGLFSLEKRWEESGRKLRAFDSSKQARLNQLKSRKELGGQQSNEIINGIKLSQRFGVSFLEGGAAEISANISEVLSRGNTTGADKLKDFIGNKQRARGARITTDGQSSTLSPGAKDIFDRQIVDGLPILFDNAVSELPEPLNPGRGQVSTDQLISSSAKQAIKGYFFEGFIRRASQNLLADNDKTDPIFDFAGAGNKGALGKLFGGRFVTPNEFKVSPTSENIANAISKAIAISPASALQYFNSGGSVEDTVPALLTPGEFVINKKAASALGASRLGQLNKADKIQGFNKGGAVQRLARGGSVLPARSEDPTRMNTTATNTAISAIQEVARALEALGVSASASARLVEAGGAISITTSERALQADVNRLRIAGASATDIYRAEQQLGQVREQNANRLNAQQVLSGASGGTLQNIQTAAERERERLLNERRTVMASRGRSAAEIEDTLSNDTRYQDYVRRQSYQTATTQVTGAPARTMREAGVTGTDIEQYINQSMMDRRTLAQMDAQLIRTREQELRNSAEFASASRGEQNRMLKDLRARNSEELEQRRQIARDLAKDRGLTSDIRGQVGRGVRTTGALFGVGTFAESEAPGGGIGGRLNRFSAGAQRAGFGLSFAGGMIGNTIGNAIGGKTGSAVGAASSAFASSVGVGAMFGPMGALIGVVTGATSAIKAWRDAVASATLAEEQEKTEKASNKIQKAFEKLEKSTTKAESSSNIKEIAEQLGVVSGSFGRARGTTTEQMTPTRSRTADFAYGAANVASELASKAFNFIGARLGVTEDRPLNFNGFKREIDQAQLSKEISVLAKNSGVFTSLPQIFEQGLRKGQTLSQIEAKIGPDSLASLKEIFAVAQGNENITGLMAQRSAATQELAGASTEAEREKLKQRINNLNILIRRIAEQTFNADIKKSIIDKIAAEKQVEEAAASATIRINLFAESLKNISSAVDKAGADFQAAQRQIAINLGSAFGDQIQMVGPDRRDENILDNIRAYSIEAIREQIGKVGSDFRFNPEVTKEAQSAATNQKILLTELPKILAEIAARESGGFDPEGSAAEVIKKKLGAVLDGKVENPAAIIKDVIQKITPKLQSRQGVTIEELLQDSKALNDILSADTQTLEVFGSLVKQANDQVANITAQLNRYSAALNQATELQIQRENVAIEGENQLNQALGGNLTLSDLNAAFENSIDILTSRIGADGRPVRGTGTLDPKQIQQRMLEKEAEAANIQKQLDKEKPPIDSARFKELNSALLKTTAEARNLQTAHQKLANDSSRASNALAKISEIRQQNEARQSLFLEVLKNSANPEWQMSFKDSVDAFQDVMSGRDVGPQGWEKAVQGLEYKMRVNPREAQAIQERFIEKAAKIVGAGEGPEVQQLLQDLIKNMGVGQLTPEMQALVGEFYKYNDVQQAAIAQSADRIIESGELFFNAIDASAKAWVNTIGAAGLENPIQVKPLREPVGRARGGMIYAQDGGHMVNFQPKGTDTIPAMLTPGEFVVNKKATAKNMGLLKAINNGAKGYSRGGVVYLAEGGMAGLSKEEIEANIAQRIKEQQLTGSYKALPSGETAFVPNDPNDKRAEERYLFLQDSIDKWKEMLNNAPAEQPDPRGKDLLLGGLTGKGLTPAATPTATPTATPSRPKMTDLSEERKQREKEYLEGKKQRREAFLANNPAYARQEEKRIAQENQEMADAMTWARDQGIRGGSKEDIVKEYKKFKREERSARERKALYGSSEKLTPEEAREKAKLRRGEFLAQKFKWTADSMAGAYEGQEAGDVRDPIEVMALKPEDKEALTAYQNAQTDKLAQEERERKTGERLAAREKEQMQAQAELARQQQERNAVRDAEFETKKAQEAKLKAERDETVKQNIANLESSVQTSVQARLAASRKNEAEAAEKRLENIRIKRERERTEQAISIAQNDPRSIKTEGLSPEEQAEAKNLGVSEEKYAFDKNVNKFKSQLKDPSQISEETESIAARLRDVINANRAEQIRIEKEKADQGWFSRLKTGITLSDPYSQIEKDASQKASTAEYLLSQLRSTQGLSSAEKIELNNRTRNGYLSLIRNRPGDRKQFEEMMDVENNAIDVTRDAVFDVATSFVPAGSAVKAARGATKTASLAYRAGQTAATGARSGAISGLGRGILIGGEEGSLSTVATETAKGAAFGAATSAAVPALGATASKFGNMTGRAASAILPSSATKAAGSVVKKVGDAANFDFTGYARKKIADSDALVEKRFKAWEKYETQRLAQEKIQKRMAPKRLIETPQSEWLRKNKPLAARSKEELETAVTKGQEMAERFQKQGIEAPDFTKVETSTIATKNAAMNKAGASKRITRQQVLDDAYNLPEDQLSKTPGGEGKYGGSRRYNLEDDLLPKSTTKTAAASSVGVTKTKTSSLIDQIGSLGGTMPTIGPGAILKGLTAPLRTSPAKFIGKSFYNVFGDTLSGIKSAATADLTKIPQKMFGGANTVKQSGKARIAQAVQPKPSVQAVQPKPSVQAVQPKPSSSKPVSGKTAGTARISSDALDNARAEASGLRFKNAVSESEYSPYLREWDEMMDVGVPNEYRTYGVTSRTAARSTDTAKKIENVAIESQKARGIKTGRPDNIGENNYFGDMIGDTRRNKNRSFGVSEQKINRAGDTRKMLQIYGDDPSGRGSTILYSIPLEEAEKLGLKDKLLKQGYTGFARGGIVYASKGQLIPFVPKGTDTVPAMLTPGEFVINRAATQKHLPLLKAINNNQVPGYARGGKVKRFQYGGMADQSGGGGGGVSNIGLDTSGLDAAFNSFASNVESLKSVMDSFAGAASNITAGFSQLSQLESGANRIGTAAASISSAAQTFGTVIANFNTSISAIQSAFEKIPSSVDFRVSGSVPINITVDVNGGDGLQESLATFQDQIFTEVSNGIKNAMPGVNISFTRTT